MNILLNLPVDILIDYMLLELQCYFRSNHGKADRVLRARQLQEGHREHGSTVAQWLALLLHSVRDPGSIPALVTVCVEFALFPRVCVGFLRVLRFPPTLQRCVRLIGHAKLPLVSGGIAG